MPFDFFHRFQRNYIQNAIKVFDKTLSQLFLVARKKVKHHQVRCCNKSCNLFHGLIIKLWMRAQVEDLYLCVKKLPWRENCDVASKMRNFCERDISAVYASIVLKIW